MGSWKWYVVRCSVVVMCSVLIVCVCIVGIPRITKFLTRLNLTINNGENLKSQL